MTHTGTHVLPQLTQAYLYTHTGTPVLPTVTQAHCTKTTHTAHLYTQAHQY